MRLNVTDWQRSAARGAHGRVFGSQCMRHPSVYIATTLSLPVRGIIFMYDL